MNAKALRHVDGITFLICVAAAACITAVSLLHEGYQSPASGLGRWESFSCHSS